MARDDPILTTMRYISKHEVLQKYNAILPDTLTNQEIKEFDVEKTLQALKASPGQRLKTTAKVAKYGKKKLPAIVPNAKGLETLSEVALSRDEQMKIATKRSKTQFYSSHTSGSGDGVDTQLKVPDKQQQKVTGTYVGAGDRPERVYTPQTIRSLMKKKIKRAMTSDAEMTDAQQENVQPNQVMEDTHVTLTTVPPAVRQQSSSISSDLVSKFINPSPDTAGVLVRSTNQPQTSYAVAASLSKFELKKILIDKMEENKSINRTDIQKNLYNTLVESYNSDKDIITSYGDVVTLKRGRDDQNKDEDPSAGSN
nr:hypothetical protein [Tanacetum cinerariifolium]